MEKATKRLSLFQQENGFVVPGRLYFDVNGGAYLLQEIPLIISDETDHDLIQVDLYEIKHLATVPLSGLVEYQKNLTKE